MKKLGEVKIVQDFIKKAASIVSGKTILDVASCAGRNAIYFAKLGYLVDAIDHDEDLLQKLKLRANEEGVEIRSTIQDIKNLHLTKNYDVIIVSYLLHFFKESVSEHILDGLWNALDEQGYIIIQAFDDNSEFSKISGREDKFYPSKSKLIKLFPKGKVILDRPETVKTVAGPMCSIHQLLIQKL